MWLVLKCFYGMFIDVGFKMFIICVWWCGMGRGLLVGLVFIYLLVKFVRVVWREKVVFSELFRVVVVW